jgi:hypothetical protein
MNREWMERQVDLAMAGYPEYEIEDDEFTEPHNPLLEQYPNQRELKSYLEGKGYIEFWGFHWLGGKRFAVLGPRGNLAWCCDPDCDRVIVGVPLSMFLNEGRKGEIAQHPECFERNLQAGCHQLSRGA